jgi:NADPH2:quinone reductase
MRAVYVRAFAPFETIGVEEVPAPQPGPGEVVVDVVAAEVNYPDMLVIAGQYQFRPPLPFSPGKAAAGRVSALGAGVRDLAVGDHVAVQVEYGAYAERLKARAVNCFKMPANMAFHTAAALGLVYQTAWFALKDRAAFKPGEIVLVLGASGGIGFASVQLAKAFGAKMVIAGVRGERNENLATQAGADHVIDLAVPNLQDVLREKVYAMTDKHGADVVIDPVGGDANAAALRALAWCGRLIIVGFASNQVPAIKTNYLLLKNIAVIGIQWSDYRERTPERVSEAQRGIFELYAQGRLEPHISGRLPLDQFADGLRALRDGKAHGKFILQVRPE